MRRFFISAEQINQAEPAITGPDVHHVRDVLRLRPGTEVVVFDGMGHDYHARIISMDRNRIRVSVIAPIPNSSESPLTLTLAQGLLKDKKMDLLVRQLTELGVTRWSPFFARRSVPAPDQKRMDARCRRWRKISLAAIKQCGRNRTMVIDPVISFADLLAHAEAYELKLICWENFSSATPMGRLGVGNPASIFVMIGPEGGFSDEEVAQAQDAGFQAVGMGPRILRAETAALAAGVMAQLIFGDMNENVLDNPEAVL